MMDAIEWRDDIPQITPAKHIFTEEEYQTEYMLFALRGHAGRWCVQRTTNAGVRQRTKFYANLKRARAIFDELISE